MFSEGFQKIGVVSIVAVLVAGVGLPARAEAGSCDDDRVEKVVELVNEERSSRGLGEVECAEKLVQVAEAHSRDQCEHNRMSHEGSDGSRFPERYREAGIEFGTGAENVSRGTSSAEAVHRQWMNSNGHRRNILKQGLNRIGVGYIECRNGRFWTQTFAGPGPGDGRDQGQTDQSGTAGPPGSQSDSSGGDPSGTRGDSDRRVESEAREMPDTHSDPDMRDAPEPQTASETRNKSGQRREARSSSQGGSGGTAGAGSRQNNAGSAGSSAQEPSPMGWRLLAEPAGWIVGGGLGLLFGAAAGDEYADNHPDADRLTWVQLSAGLGALIGGPIGTYGGAELANGRGTITGAYLGGLGGLVAGLFVAPYQKTPAGELAVLGGVSMAGTILGYEISHGIKNLNSGQVAFRNPVIRVGNRGDRVIFGAQFGF